MVFVNIYFKNVVKIVSWLKCSWDPFLQWQLLFLLENVSESLNVPLYHVHVFCKCCDVYVGLGLNKESESESESESIIQSRSIDPP